MTEAAPTPGSLAFARYIGAIHHRDPFREAGPIAVVIEASLPTLHKESRVLAVRDTGGLERSQYNVLESDGDDSVVREVIAPYLAEEQNIEDLPLSSVLVSPANYEFRFVGEARNTGAPAYVFRILPKKKREGLIRGELWLDSDTGVAVLQAGTFVKTASSNIRRINMVRDTRLQKGSPCSRITRVSFETRLSGRGYLTITEFPSLAVGAEALACG